MSRWVYAWSDHRDSWLADDKLAHFFGAFAGYCLTHSFKAVLVVVALVELVELYRYHLWVARGAPYPQPWMTDKISVKDILCGIAGALLAWVA